MNFKSLKMFCAIFFLRAVVMVNVNSHSGIYDLAGKREKEIFLMTSYLYMNCLKLSFFNGDAVSVIPYH